MTKELREKLRTEYATSSISLRKLADKYGVPRGTVTRIAAEEGWSTLRTAESAESIKNYISDSAQVMLRTQEEAASMLWTCSEKLSSKVFQLLDLEEPLAPRDLKAISGALLDIKILFNCRTPEEKREQEARVRNLEKQLEDKSQKNSEPITVIFGNGEELI